MQSPQDPLPYASPAMPAPNARPTSVTVISIIVIVLASLGVICSPFALLPYVTDLPQADDPVNKALRDNAIVNGWTILATIVGWFISIGLIFAASSALKMRESGREWLVKLSAVQLVMLFIGTCVTLIFVIPDVLAAGRANPGNDAVVIAGIVGGVGGILIGAILPVLTIYFMTRPHVRDAFATNDARVGY